MTPVEKRHGREKFHILHDGRILCGCLSVEDAVMRPGVRIELAATNRDSEWCQTCAESYRKYMRGD